MQFQPLASHGSTLVGEMKLAACHALGAKIVPKFGCGCTINNDWKTCTYTTMVPWCLQWQSSLQWNKGYRMTQNLLFCCWPGLVFCGHFSELDWFPDLSPLATAEEELCPCFPLSLLMLFWWVSIEFKLAVCFLCSSIRYVPAMGLRGSPITWSISALGTPSCSSIWVTSECTVLSVLKDAAKVLLLLLELRTWPSLDKLGILPLSEPFSPLSQTP